ncbi:MAG: EamA family transporter [Candidatus Levybacteria bacterium]|nr:EamA family transporter [Candidatus Levybacteria bacterium]
MWFFFALASAIIYSFRGILEKKIISNVNNYILGFAVRAFALPFFFLPLLLFPDKVVPLQNLSPEFWFVVFFIAFICTPLETIFYYKALDEEEVSFVLPLLSLAPVVTLGLSAVILKEIPNIFGIIGVLLIILGIYTLKLSHAKDGLLQPFRHIKNSRGAQLMTIVFLSLGLGSVLDKIGVANSNAYFFALINYIGVSLTLFLIALVKARAHMKEQKTYWKQFLLIGSVVAGYTLLYLLALEESFASYAIAIRNASIIFTIILGYLFFKEKDLKQKILAAIIISAGLIFIKVLG